MNRSNLLLGMLLLGLVAPSLASAQTLGDSAGLAPPGPCAEPRSQALRADPVYNTASTLVEGGRDFTIAGEPLHHFDPVDVAGGPEASSSSPRLEPLDQFTPCSSPDAGCVNFLGGLSESAVVPDGPPGVGGNQP